MTVARNRSRRLIARAIALVVCLGGATLCLVRVAANDDTASAARADATSVRIVELRAALRRVHLAEVDELVLELLGVHDHAAVVAARTEREATRVSAEDELQRIAADSDTNGLEARALVSMMAADGVAPGEVPPLTLFDAGRALVKDERPLEGAIPVSVAQLYDVMRLDSIGHQILNDALDASYVLEQPAVPALLAEYVAKSEPYLRSDGGYLGSDPEQPLVDSYVWYPSTPTPHPLYTDISEIVRTSGLWTFDQWIVSWQDGGDPGSAPMSLPEVADLARSVDDQTRTMIDATLADARTQHEASADSAAARSTRFLIAAIALFVLAGSLVLAAGWMIVGKIQRSRRLVSTDRLTGAGNRHHLAVRTARLLDDPAFLHHLVAVIDMDRFKMINDTWGHAAGDAVLVEVATRVQEVLDSICRATPGHDGTVVRLGGDEFLLSVHGRAEIDRDDVARRLDAIRQSTISVRDGETITLAFSIGIATADGRAVLAELLDTADFATYEDKAKRANLFTDRREPNADAGPTPAADGTAPGDRAGENPSAPPEKKRCGDSAS